MCIRDSLLAVVYLFCKMSKDAKFVPLRLIAIAVLAGAWGNMIDRVRLGYVVDFFYFKPVSYTHLNVSGSEEMPEIRKE